jgi:hypothetical protein
MGAERIFDEGEWVPIRAAADRLGKHRTTIQKKVRREGVGTIRPLKTAGGTLDVMGVSGAWVNDLARRYRIGEENAEALS